MEAAADVEMTSFGELLIDVILTSSYDTTRLSDVS